MDVFRSSCEVFRTDETTSAINTSESTFRHNHTISAVNCCMISSDIFSFPSNSSSVSLRGTVKVRMSSAISKHASTRYDRHPEILSSLLEKSMLQFSRAARTLVSDCQWQSVECVHETVDRIYIFPHTSYHRHNFRYFTPQFDPSIREKREVAQPKGENRLTGTQYAQRALHLAASAVHLRRHMGHRPDNRQRRPKAFSPHQRRTPRADQTLAASRKQGLPCSVAARHTPRLSGAAAVLIPPIPSMPLTTRNPVLFLLVRVSNNMCNL
jgi:hypothetical protein